MTKEEIEIVKKTVKELIEELNIDASFEVSIESAENDLELITVQVDSSSPASLIGFHGETLRAMQTMLLFMIHKNLDRWVRLEVNVGDYLEKREEQLRKLALNLAMKAKFSGETQIIPNLTAAERRMVHLILADHQDVYTQSEGEGKERYLMIKPKKTRGA